MEKNKIEPLSIIWITWENQRRNRELSKALAIKLYEMSEIGEISNPIKKYVFGIMRTLFILVREKPKIVFCQNPSIVLSFFIVLMKFVTKMIVCVDAHNAGIFPAEGKYQILNWVARFIQRKADLTIVSNEALRQHVEVNGGRAFDLPDKIPSIPTIPIKKSHDLKGKINILFICSYAADEPYQEVFDAARRIDPNIFIYTTGNYKKGFVDIHTLPNNVILTGFLPEFKYREMLNAVDIVIDLTTRENCLVCGAYEAVAVEKPMILSNTQILREYFSMGAVYADNTCESLIKAISDVLKRKDELIAHIKELKTTREEEWQRKKDELEGILLTLRGQN